MTDTEAKRNKRRKQTAEVFTPIELVHEMLDKLPEDAWKNDSKTFCDPAAGNGNFLVEVLSYKVNKYNHNVLKALSTIYGFELMPDNIEEMKKRLLETAKKLDSTVSEKEVKQLLDNNIVCCDTLEYFKNHKNTVIDI